MDIKENDGKFKNTGFRPLIWGFFFYKNNIFFYEDLNVEFPSHNSGILFLSAFDGEVVMSPYFSFRPLIRGLFFMVRPGDTLWTICGEMFPSPHSGILFLSCRYDMPPSLNIFAIFRRILHFLAQKGFPLTQSIHFSPYPSASARIKSFFIHIVPSPIPLNQYIITSSSFISPMPHDLTLVWS